MNAKYIQIYRQPLSYPSIEFSFKVTQFQKLYVRSIGRFLWKVAPRDRQRTLLVPRKGGTVTGCETNRANYLAEKAGARGQQRSAELSTTDYRFSRTFIPGDRRPMVGQLIRQLERQGRYDSGLIFCTSIDFALKGGLQEVSTYLFRKPWN